MTAVPTWFANQTDKTWVAVANGTGQHVNDVLGTDSTNGVTDSWTGGAVVQHYGEYTLAANGGHTPADGAGNCVYACKIRSETPSWVRLTDSSASQAGGDINDFTYTDGNPRSMHGWHACCGGDGKVWYGAMTGMYNSGGWSSQVCSFDRRDLEGSSFPVTAANAPWVFYGHGLTTIDNGINLEASSACYDKVGNRVWSVAGNGVNSLGQSVWSTNCNTGVITRHSISLESTGWGRARWACVAHDLRLAIFGCPPEGVVIYLDISTPTPTAFVTKTPTGTFASDSHGSIYHRPSRSVLLYDGGATIQKLLIPSNPASGTWAFSSVSNNGGGVTPTAAPSAGVYSKFQLIENMGNGQSAAVVVNDVTEATYVYKLPVAGV